MRQTGFTRAGTLAPMAGMVTAMGGSIDRVFQRAELPPGLLQTPDMPVPLRDHFRLLAMASRELGDGLFPARLGQQVAIEHLGVFGLWVTQAPSLYEAILRANASMPYMLQSATQLVLRIRGQRANWSYELADPAIEGRQQNEVLAMSYMVAVGRYFLGAAWAPGHIIAGGWPMPSNGPMEQILRTNVVFRDLPITIVFDRQQLAARNPDGRQQPGLSAEDLERGLNIPDPSDFVAMTSALIELELLGRYPSLAWVCRRMGISGRTLQRQLQMRGVRFSDLLQGVLQKRAFILLRTTGQTVTEVAAQLGYNDPAHFTRAFERWTGMSPRGWRAGG